MIIKALLCCVLVAFSTFIGYRFSDKYRHSYEVFDVLYNSNLSFNARMGLIDESVKRYLERLKPKLEKTLSGAEKILSGDSFECVDTKLTSQQRKLITDYVNSLGVSDAENQKMILSSYGELFYNEREKSSVLSKKYTVLCLKIGFSLGLTTAVIII